jgi:hypothetical protein
MLYKKEHAILVDFLDDKRRGNKLSFVVECGEAFGPHCKSKAVEPR